MRSTNARVFLVDGVSLSVVVLVDRLQTIRRHHPAAPILLLAREDRELLRSALKNGITGVLAPDDGLETCLKALRQLAQGHSWLPVELVGELVGGPRAGRTTSPLEQLPPRQRQVLELIGNGMTTRQIAELLGIGVKTVETHRARLMQQLGVRKAHELTVLAVQAQRRNAA